MNLNPTNPCKGQYPNAVLVTNCDDWEGLYVDGELVAQDHQVKRDNFLGLESYETWEVSSEYTHEVGYLPDYLSEIPDDQFLA